MMRDILISIDDTDNLESAGTGKLAGRLCADIEANGWGRASRVTRHQLFVNRDIPYTSHNSAMCFIASIHPHAYPTLIDYAADFLRVRSAPGSDPGLCVAALDGHLDHEALASFGQSAKTRVLTKSDAYAAATRLKVHLSEHGGTGQGVVGALAGAGLRLSGNDGRFRGWFSMESGTEDGIIPADELLSHEWVDRVLSLAGEVITGLHRIQLTPKIKTVLLDGKSVVLVEPLNSSAPSAGWRILSKESIKKQNF